MVATIVISIILLAIVALIVRSIIMNKLKGKSGCGCGCDSCAAKNTCHSSEKK